MPKQKTLEVDGKQVIVSRKPIKHIYLRTNKQGEVMVSAPSRISDAAVRNIIREKSDWINGQILKQQSRPQKPKPEFKNGERHHFLGQEYTLHKVESRGTGRISINSSGIIEMFVPNNASAQYCYNLIWRWYKNELLKLLPPLMEKWQATLGVTASEYRLRKMKSRWGSCNTITRRIWLNLELIKKPAACIEYVVVHELAHLIERGHNARFKAIMDAHLPNWRELRQELRCAE